MTLGDYTTAVGAEEWAIGDGATVLGFNSYAQAANGTHRRQCLDHPEARTAWRSAKARWPIVPIACRLAPRQEWTDAGGTVHAAIDRQITNVAAGTEATDAVNKGQLDEAIATVGGEVGELAGYAVNTTTRDSKDRITLRARRHQDR